MSSGVAFILRTCWSAQVLNSIGYSFAFSGEIPAFTNSLTWYASNSSEYFNNSFNGTFKFLNAPIVLTPNLLYNSCFSVTSCGEIPSFTHLSIRYVSPIG